MKSWPVARVGAEEDRGHAHLVDLRAAALRHHLRERLGDRLADLGARVVRAGRDRASRRRVQAAALRHDQLDRVEEALVLRDRRVHHRRELRDHVAARVAEGRVGLDLGARVGAGEVDGEVDRRDRDLAVDVDVVVALRVVVDVDVRLVDAVGPARDLLAEAPLRVLDRVLDRAAHRLGAVAQRAPPAGGARRAAPRRPARAGRRGRSACGCSSPACTSTSRRSTPRS